MKIKVSIILLLTLFSIQLLAQQYIVRVIEPGNRKSIYINEKGERISDIEFFTALDFSEEGVAIVKKNSGSYFAFLNSKGEIIEPEKELKPFINSFTENIEGFKSGMVRTKPYKIGAFNTKGELIVPTIYKDLSMFDGNYAIGQEKRSFYIVKNNGDRQEIELDKIKAYKPFSEGLAPICLRNQWGFVDTLGKMAIEAKYKSVGYFNGGIAWAKDMNGLVGYIDKSGNWVVQPQYTAGMDYDKQSGLARVKKNGDWGYINMKDEFDNLGITGTFHNFYEGLLVKHGKGKVGFIDHTGNWAIEPQFEYVQKFFNGFAKARLNGKWGIIDKKGRWVIEPKYKEVGEFIKINH